MECLVTTGSRCAISERIQEFCDIAKLLRVQQAAVRTERPDAVSLRQPTSKIFFRSIFLIGWPLNKQTQTHLLQLFANSILAKRIQTHPI